MFANITEMLARFANITEMSKGDFHKLVSTIVVTTKLGSNNVVTTYQEILAMGLRLAGEWDMFGLTEAHLLGISTELTTMGVNADVSEPNGPANSEELAKFSNMEGASAGEYAGIFK